MNTLKDSSSKLKLSKNVLLLIFLKVMKFWMILDIKIHFESQILVLFDEVPFDVFTNTINCFDYVDFWP